MVGWGGFVCVCLVILCVKAEAETEWVSGYDDGNYSRPQWIREKRSNARSFAWHLLFFLISLFNFSLLLLSFSFSSSLSHTFFLAVVGGEVAAKNEFPSMARLTLGGYLCTGTHTHSHTHTRTLAHSHTHTHTHICAHTHTHQFTTISKERLSQSELFWLPPTALKVSLSFHLSTHLSSHLRSIYLPLTLLLSKLFNFSHIHIHMHTH